MDFMMRKSRKKIHTFGGVIFSREIIFISDS